MPYPCLLAWSYSAVRPYEFTMVLTHLRFRYAWIPARQLPNSAISISAFYPRFTLMVATHQNRGYAFPSALES